MSIIESLRDYILTFPDLPEGAVQIDYLGGEAGQFTLEPVPCDPVYKRYSDGDCMWQFPFVFASRMYYGADVTLCAENQAFFEALADWIEGSDRAGILPALEEGLVPVAIEVASRGYAFAENAETARYQMQLRLLYEKA